MRIGRKVRQSALKLDWLENSTTAPKILHAISVLK